MFIMVLSIQLVVNKELERCLHDCVGFHRAIAQPKPKRNIFIFIAALSVPWIQY
jgi:hypothetical protein